MDATGIETQDAASSAIHIRLCGGAEGSARIPLLNSGQMNTRRVSLTGSALFAFAGPVSVG